MKRALLLACLLASCGDPERQEQRQTGPVEVLDVRRFSCTPAGDTKDCKTDLLLKTPNGVVYNLHIEDSPSLPPVWTHERCNIVYIQVPGDSRMRVLWATELK